MHATDAQLAAINGVFTDCIRRGQSIRNVMANNPGLFPVCERTVYNYVGLRVFDAVRGDLPFACSRKPRKARPARNPRTGETVQIEERMVPTFKFSNDIKDKINSLEGILGESVAKPEETEAKIEI